MKTIINGEGNILRMDDASAEVKVKTGLWKYAPKSVYKEQVRDARKNELAEIKAEKAAAKKSKKKENE